MKIIYSFNKRGYEAEYWSREISLASNDKYTFIPFNHGEYLDVNLYVRAQLLDNLYYESHPGLMKMYADLQKLSRDEDCVALITDNCFPYHPEFLRSLNVYKVMRTTDGPLTAYDRDFAYLHAYDHVLYHSPAYSRDLGMAEKLKYCGAKRYDFLPLGLFDVAFDLNKDQETLFSQERDIDILFIGAQFVNKMPLIAKVMKTFGKNCKIQGLTTFKRNLYFNAKFGFPGWIKPIPFEDYVPLYQRAKIGFNLHNRGKYTVGSYRLYDLPANGVMQISDGGEYLSTFFEPGKEIVGYESDDQLVDLLKYYLEHDEERRSIAMAGYKRVIQDYRFKDCMLQAANSIKNSLETSTEY